MLINRSHYKSCSLVYYGSSYRGTSRRRAERAIVLSAISIHCGTGVPPVSSRFKSTRERSYPVGDRPLSKKCDRPLHRIIKAFGGTV
ncbi:hypothetical protein QUB08_22900 [Microcoleus sp. BR0-C5]|uniref:hypothetical protein n=1 Tax=Microcoleus sp. BR0-C5 TaxID=2818713 RepID=UPI002FD7170E